MSCIDSNGHKRCSECKKKYKKPFESFSKSSNTKDGLDYICKKCDRERHQNYYQKHKEEIHDYRQEYVSANPHIAVAGNQKRRASKLERSNGTVTSSILKDMLRACDWTCMNPECKSSEHLTVDHVIALEGPSKGWHTTSNIQILCRSCNSAKGIRTIDYRPQDWPWR
jgi:5-methylcytosine-specific restriction endonuclease McrA